MKEPSITELVLGYMQNRPHQDLDVDEMAASLGFTRAQIQGAISNARSRKRDLAAKIEVIEKGQIYFYDPNQHAPEPTPKEASNFTVTVTPAGTVLVEDNFGNLYIAKKVN